MLDCVIQVVAFWGGEPHGGATPEHWPGFPAPPTVSPGNPGQDLGPWYYDLRLTDY